MRGRGDANQAARRLDGDSAWLACPRRQYAVRYVSPRSITATKHLKLRPRLARKLKPAARYKKVMLVENEELASRRKGILWQHKIALLRGYGLGSAIAKDVLGEL